MASAPPPTTPLEFSDEQDATRGRLATSMLLLGLALLLLAVIKLITAVVLLFSGFLGGALIELLVGGLCALLGLILLTGGSSDVRYLRTIKEHNRAHLANTVTSLRDLYNNGMILGVLVLVVAAFEVIVVYFF
jgi:hypothetical protein